MAKILIVEDDFALADEWFEALTREGHKVTTVSTTSEGKEAISRYQFDIFIVDLFYVDSKKVTPDSGIHLVRWIHRLKKDHNVEFYLHQPIIAVTGVRVQHEGPKPLTVAKSLGATHLVEKPFPAGELTALVNKALELNN